WVISSDGRRCDGQARPRRRSTSEPTQPLTGAGPGAAPPVLSLGPGSRAARSAGTQEGAVGAATGLSPSSRMGLMDTSRSIIALINAAQPICLSTALADHTPSATY